MSTRDLIDAIQTGDSVAVQSAFEASMTQRVAERIDTMRQEVAQNMFKEQAEEIEEEAELSLEDYSLEELQDYMMSEEFEQLDEISKNTLVSYIKKSVQNLPSHVMQGADINRTGDLKKANKEYSTAIKRRNGIQKAADRLSK